MMRFPPMHLATSVTNRILNLADKEMILGRVTAPPTLPANTTQQQGAALDQALYTPQPAIAAPEGTEDAVLLEQAQGGNAVDAVGGMAALDVL